MDKTEFKDVLNNIDDKTFMSVFVAHVWARQTKEEQYINQTNETNMRGFNKPDARFFGRQIQRFTRLHELPWQETILEMRHRMYKYWRQF